MNHIEKLSELVEQLRVASIGNPTWIERKSVFEYESETVEVCCILKLIRATQSLFSMELLCINGLFIDMSVIYRCIQDSVTEVYFLLENYPNKSVLVDSYLEEFFSRKIDNMKPEEPLIPTKKIQSAMIRVLKGSEDSSALNTIKRVYKTFSGYVHGSYAHIMQMYGPRSPNPTFKISGIPSEFEKSRQYSLCYESVKSVYYAFNFIANKLGEKELAREAFEIVMPLE